MKRLTLIFLFALAATTASAQDKPKQDTLVQVTMRLNDYRVLLYSIDSNIDSKKTSKEIITFIDKSAKRIDPPAQPADKPKKK